MWHAWSPSCKRLSVDLTDSEPARERRRAFVLIDRMNVLNLGFNS